MNKAVLVGINKYPEPGSCLNGCVNDVKHMREVLIEALNFSPEYIRVVCDGRATKQNIVKRLEWLCSGAKSGDRLFFHYSGHGSQVAVRYGDFTELDDMKTEILVPYDYDQWWDDPLDDDFFSDYIDNLPQDVEFIMFIDSCHSGTMSRAFSLNPFKKKTKSKYIVPPFDIQCRYMDRNLKIKKFAKHNNSDGNVHTDVKDMKHILISGCRDDQTSADAVIEGTPGGVLTTYWVKVFRGSLGCGSWLSMHEKLVDVVARSGYTQIPQLTGNESILNRAVVRK